MAIIYPPLSPQRREADPDAHASPPVGLIPYIDNDLNLNDLIYTIITVNLTLTTLFLAIRYYTRLYCLKKWNIEDGFLISAFCIYVGFAGYLYSNIKPAGIFDYQGDLEPERLSKLFYAIYIMSNLYGAALLPTKIAILLEWLRIFVPRGTRNAFSRACCALIWANVLFYTSAAFALNLSCIPRQKIWDHSVQGQCMVDMNALVAALTIMNLMSNIFILLLPQKVIWGLQIRKSKKLGISIVFAIGLLGCISACFIVAGTIQAAVASDVYWNSSSVAFWGSLEMTLLFLVISTPAVPKAASSIGIPRMASSFVSWVKLRHNRTGLEHEARAVWPSAELTRENTKPRTYTRIENHSLEPLSPAEIWEASSGQSGLDISKPKVVYAPHTLIDA
ncbi:hypothetical protein GGR54DRAFT_640491 [Hypoxylon sp. NC1633]|nr:hypothetical protein GGR54DRAFT_640491 [Hypoxylon sp. NC1633]